LPYDFSERVILPAKCRAGVPRGATSSLVSSSAIDQPFGDKPHADHQAGRRSVPRGQCVLDGLSGLGVGGRAPAASNKASFENGVCSNGVMIP